MKEKQKLYFEMACNTPLQSIRYHSMNIKCNEIMAEIEPAISEVMNSDFNYLHDW